MLAGYRHAKPDGRAGRRHRCEFLCVLEGGILVPVAMAAAGHKEAAWLAQTDEPTAIHFVNWHAIACPPLSSQRNLSLNPKP